MRLIDADALRKAFNEKIWYFDKASWDEANFLIDNAPTVEITEEQAIDKLHETGWIIRHDKEMTERPQGEWNFHTVGWLCSECNQMARTVGYCGTETFMNEFFKFCPNCGADMRGGAE